MQYSINDCCSSAVGQVLTPSFPIFTNENYALQDVVCNGTEYSFQQCDYSVSTPACYMGNRSAGVICRQSE